MCQKSKWITYTVILKEQMLTGRGDQGADDCHWFLLSPWALVTKNFQCDYGLAVAHIAAVLTKACASTLSSTASLCVGGGPSHLSFRPNLTAPGDAGLRVPGRAALSLHRHHAESLSREHTVELRLTAVSRTNEDGSTGLIPCQCANSTVKVNNDNAERQPGTVCTISPNATHGVTRKTL